MSADRPAQPPEHEIPEAQQPGIEAVRKDDRSSHITMDDIDAEIASSNDMRSPGTLGDSVSGTEGEVETREDESPDTEGAKKDQQPLWRADIGPLRQSSREPLKGEDVLLDSSQGLQSQESEMFADVEIGERGDSQTVYLWTIDQRGVNVALERTPFSTPRGKIVHTNISSLASIGGEAWFGADGHVTINAGSGRFGDGAGVTEEQWDAAAEAWRSLGYKVTQIPHGER